MLTCNAVVTPTFSTRLGRTTAKRSIDRSKRRWSPPPTAQRSISQVRVSTGPRESGAGASATDHRLTLIYHPYREHWGRNPADGATRPTLRPPLRVVPHRRAHCLDVDVGRCGQPGVRPRRPIAGGRPLRGSRRGRVGSSPLSRWSGPTFVVHRRSYGWGWQMRRPGVIVTDPDGRKRDKLFLHSGPPSVQLSQTRPQSSRWRPGHHRLDTRRQAGRCKSGGHLDVLRRVSTRELESNPRHPRWVSG